LIATRSNYPNIIKIFSLSKGRQGETGGPGADSPDATIIKDQGTKRSGSLNEIIVYSITVPAAGLWDVSWNVSGEQFYVEYEDYDPNDDQGAGSSDIIPSRVTIRLNENGTPFAQTSDPSTTTFELDNTFSYSGSSAGRNNDKTYTMSIDPDIDGNADAGYTEITGYLQAVKQ